MSPSRITKNDQMPFSTDLPFDGIYYDLVAPYFSECHLLEFKYNESAMKIYNSLSSGGCIAANCHDITNGAYDNWI